MQELRGHIVSVIYPKDNQAQTDFMVASFKTRGEVTKIAGPMFGIKEKEEIIVHGEWIDHPTYGRQFSVETWEKIIPTQRTEVIKYLGNLIGHSTAQGIVNHLGEDCIATILEQGPKCLLPISGIAEKRAEKIYRKVNENFESYKVIARLLTYGLTAHTAMKAYRHFGNNAANLIGFNPYVLTELSMVGFEAADKIAMKLGFKEDSIHRIKAATYYTLHQAMGGGHCFLYEDELSRSVIKLLKCGLGQDAVKNLFPDMKDLTLEAGAVYFNTIYHDERDLADYILKLLNTRPSPVNTSKFIAEYESRSRKTLAPEQRLAVQEAMNNNFLLLIGGPGTGKTETLRAVYYVFRRLHPRAKIGAAALSGRAAGHIREATGINAVTMHSLLGMSPGAPPEYSSINPLPHDLLIIDEGSMVDLTLAYNFFSAVKQGAKVLFVGDKDQLPSVGQGKILADMLEASLPRVELKYNYRQLKGSSIISNAHRIINGEMPVFNNDDFVFLHRESPQEVVKAIVDKVRELLKNGYRPKDIQVLSPGKQHETGTNNLNTVLQEALNPNGQPLERTRLRINDRVIQKKNNKLKEVSNGDIGYISRVEDGDIYVRFFDKEVCYDLSELDELNLGYAITSHKSQGSEYKVVITPITTQHYVLLSRNLLYTTATRPKEKAFFIGTKKALAIAIRNNKPIQRNTRLRDRLLNVTFLKSKRKKVSIEIPGLGVWESVVE